jgi:hypothetical protein
LLSRSLLCFRNQSPEIRAILLDFGPSVLRMNFEVGFALDSIALNLKEPFILAVDQNVAKFEVLDENHGGCVVDHGLQTLLARAKRVRRC